MQFREITEDEFNRLPKLNKIICNAEYPHKFAILTTNENRDFLALSWESEIVQPQIIDDQESAFFWFGVDQQIVAIRKSDLKIIVAINLHSNLLEIRKVEDIIVFRCELEIICFNIYGFLVYSESLPEISEAVIIQAKEITISLIDGETFTLPKFLLNDGS